MLDTQTPRSDAPLPAEGQEVTTMPFGKHKGLPLTAVPTDYLHSLLGQCKLSSGFFAAVSAELTRRGLTPPAQARPAQHARAATAPVLATPPTDARTAWGGSGSVPTACTAPGPWTTRPYGARTPTRPRPTPAQRLSSTRWSIWKGWGSSCIATGGPDGSAAPTTGRRLRTCIAWSGSANTIWRY
jgi:hypothetical protein